MPDLSSASVEGIAALPDASLRVLMIASGVFALKLIQRHQRPLRCVEIIDPLEIHAEQPGAYHAGHARDIGQMLLGVPADIFFLLARLRAGQNGVLKTRHRRLRFAANLSDRLHSSLCLRMKAIATRQMQLEQ